MVLERTALVLIDMQQDVVFGPWWTWWPDVDEVVRACAKLRDACHDAGALVIYTKVAYLVDGSNTPQAIATGVAQPTEYLVEGTEGVEIIRALTPDSRDMITTKNLVSAFSIAELSAAVKELSIETILVAGLAVEGGVRATVEDAHHLGLRTVVVADACAAFGPESYRSFMTEIFPSASLVMDVDAAIDLLMSG